ALELYLKSLNTNNVYHDLADEGSPDCQMVTARPAQRGHCLVRQHDALAQEFRDELRDAYATSPVVRGAGTFREALTTFDGVFEQSRYIFEERDPVQGLPLKGLVRLVALVGRYVEGLPRRVVF